MPVKFTDDYDDFADGFKAVQQDLKAHPDRQHKSVVLTSRGTFPSYTPAEAKSNPWVQRTFGKTLKKLLDLGVPIVCASGNNTPKQPRAAVIDSLPMVLQADDMPIINVGAAQANGQRLAMSQDGPQVTIYAPGEQVKAQTKEDRNLLTQSGTSLGMSTEADTGNL